MQQNGVKTLNAIIIIIIIIVEVWGYTPSEIQGKAPSHGVGKKAPEAESYFKTKWAIYRALDLTNLPFGAFR